MSKEDIDRVAAKNAEKHEIEVELILAFIQVESNFNPYAHRFEAHWRYALPEDQQRKFAALCGITLTTENVDECTSFGLMQVMGSVARELGYVSNLLHLCEPEIGIHYGCLKLGLNLKKYPQMTDAVSAYNQGSPRMAAGQYANQDYVDKIMSVYERLKLKGNKDASSNSVPSRS